MKKPSKPMGLFIRLWKHLKNRKDMGWVIVDDSGHGLSQSCSFPTSNRICSGIIYKSLFNEGELVIAAGGGGIPVIENEKGP